MLCPFCFFFQLANKNLLQWRHLFMSSFLEFKGDFLFFRIKLTSFTQSRHILSPFLIFLTFFTIFHLISNSVLFSFKLHIYFDNFVDSLCFSYLKSVLWLDILFLSSDEVSPIYVFISLSLLTSAL